MPSLPINRANAWDHWRQGRIHATNSDDLGINAPATTAELRNDTPKGNLTPARDALSNIAIKKGLNALRLFLEYGSVIFNPSTGLNADGSPRENRQELSLVAEDWYKIGVADAISGKTGAWDNEIFLSTTTARSGLFETSTTYRDIACQIQNVLDQCAARGMGIIVTGNPFGRSIWDASLSLDNYIQSSKTTTLELQNALCSFWQAFTKKWGTHPALIGIDLMNEPSGYPQKKDTTTSPETLRPYTFGEVMEHEYFWPKLAQKIIYGIRAVEQTGTDTPIIIEAAHDFGIQTFNQRTEVDKIKGAPLKDPKSKLIYSFHPYGPLEFTSQGVYTFTYLSLGATYPFGFIGTYVQNGKTFLTRYSNSSDFDQVYKEYIDIAADTKAPIFAGEFSACQPLIDEVYPKRSDRIANGQYVSEPQTLPSVSNIKDVNQIAQERRISKITRLTDGKYQFQFFWDGSNTDGFDIKSPINETAVNACGYEIKKDTLDGAWKIYKKGTSETFDLDVINWQGGADNRPELKQSLPWISNDRLRATVHIIDFSPGGAAPLLILNRAPISIESKKLTFDVIASPEQNAMIEFNETATKRAVLTLETSRTPAEIDAARLAYIRDSLKMFKRNKFSWAWFADAGGDGPGGPVSWRASPAINELLAQAARGEVIVG